MESVKEQKILNKEIKKEKISDNYKKLQVTIYIYRDTYKHT
mgnify:CR=1 FL=1